MFSKVCHYWVQSDRQRPFPGSLCQIIPHETPSYGHFPLPVHPTLSPPSILRYVKSRFCSRSGTPRDLDPKSQQSSISFFQSRKVKV